MYSSSKGTHQTLCLRNSRDGCCENIINRKKKKKNYFYQMILKCNRGRGSIKKKEAKKKNTTTRKRIVFIWSRHECQQEEIWRRRRGSMKLLRVCSAAVLWDRRVLYIHFFFFLFSNTHTHTHKKEAASLCWSKVFTTFGAFDRST